MALHQLLIIHDLGSYMRNLLVAFLLSFITTACVEVGKSPAQYYDIPTDRIAEYETKALNGDGEAALALNKFYLFTNPDKKKEIYWLEVSAKNGSNVGMYNYGVYLLRDAKPSDKNEARYWLEKAYRNGDLMAKDRLEELEQSQKK